MTDHEATRTCPICDTQSLATVDVCKCGHRFDAPPSSGDPTLGQVRLGLVVLGVGMALWATLVFETSIGASYDRVENIGLLQHQLIFFQSGAVTSVIGIILYATDRLLGALARLQK